jgi:hypothetical protein
MATASEGELDLGFIHFEGQDYKFFDPDGDGHMDLGEAERGGFPRKLFKLLDHDNDGRITPAEFKSFQREQRRLRRRVSASWIRRHLYFYFLQVMPPRLCVAYHSPPTLPLMGTAAIQRILDY